MCGTERLPQRKIRKRCRLAPKNEQRIKQCYPYRHA